MTTAALALADLLDYSTFPPGGAPFDFTARRIRGSRVVLEWVMRAWLSPTGSLPWAPDRGFDILGLENGDFTLEDLYNIKARLAQEARAVMYVRAARVSLTLQQLTLSIDAQLTLVDGVTYPLAVRIPTASSALHENLPLGVIVAFGSNENGSVAA